MAGYLKYQQSTTGVAKTDSVFADVYRALNDIDKSVTALTNTESNDVNSLLIQIQKGTGGGSGYITHIVWVDGTQGIDDGNMQTVKRTVQGAMNAIGNATSSAQFSDSTQLCYIVNLAPATYTENVNVALRPIVKINLNGSVISGNVSQDWTGQSGLFSGTITQSIFSIAGSADLRPGYTPDDGSAEVGVIGNIDMTTVHFALQLQLSDMRVKGNISFSQAGGAGYSQEFLDNVVISGMTYQLVGGLVEVFARNSELANFLTHPGDPALVGIGGFSGTSILFRNLQDVFVDGSVSVSSGSDGWFLTHVRWNPAASPMTLAGVTSLVQCDQYSYNQLLLAFPSGNRAGLTYNILDAQSGGIVEGVWTNWSSSAVVTGFSGSPSVQYWYKTVGKTLKIRVEISGTGDGSGALTFTLPFAANGALIGFDIDKIPAQIQNGLGGFQATPGLAQLSGATSVAVYTDWHGNGWAAGSTKNATVCGDIDLA
jgi:hypothetical protein